MLCVCERQCEKKKLSITDIEKLSFVKRFPVDTKSYFSVKTYVCGQLGVTDQMNLAGAD